MWLRTGAFGIDVAGGGLFLFGWLRPGFAENLGGVGTQRAVAYHELSVDRPRRLPLLLICKVALDVLDPLRVPVALLDDRRQFFLGDVVELWCGRQSLVLADACLECFSFHVQPLQVLLAAAKLIDLALQRLEALRIDSSLLLAMFVQPLLFRFELALQGGQLFWGGVLGEDFLSRADPSPQIKNQGLVVVATILGFHDGLVCGSVLFFRLHRRLQGGRRIARARHDGH
mmetsp:Transcript_34642/g.95448  ORF Transcript_34642/g.95448 Transcript_34642/m.95448 type:complete len:229 (+) Transcript_34642:447-1133(+)